MADLLENNQNLDEGLDESAVNEDLKYFHVFILNLVLLSYKSFALHRSKDKGLFDQVAKLSAKDNPKITLWVEKWQKDISIKIYKTI